MKAYTVKPPPLPGYVTMWAVRRMCLRAVLLTGFTFAFTWRDLAQEAPPGGDAPQEVAAVRVRGRGPPGPARP